ncbi:MAG: PSD1 and planctomycete cytochrome C domain-containing protein [Verrucomicrobiota bacterium]
MRRNGNRRLCALLMASVGSTALVAAELPPPASRSVDFAKDIQPIFEKNCYACHGSKNQESSLRLDRKADALKGGESGPVILPGKSAESVLIRAVAHFGELKMPKKGDRLSAEQVGLLRAWVDQGAVWPEAAVEHAAKDPKDHWAFKAPVRPAVPKAKNTRWVRTPIDNFILARLDAEKLKPSPEADKITLLRRLHLDLTGLPPTIAEVDAFLADKSKNAYEKQVERLLNSPHYGERWGRHWLDAARYADSDGYEKDMSREVWAYRDYVVNAFNRDLPYNQFIIEQIAGDLLPNRTQDQLMATGFLRNSMVNMEGAIDPEQFRMEAMFDRMDALGKSVLGLTIQCGQCHTHKYDPLTQEEYYRMFAFINNDHEARPVVYTLEQQMQIASLRQQMQAIEAELKHATPDWAERMASWEREVAGNQPEWTILRELDQEGDRSQRYEFLDDGSLRACGYAPTKFTQYFRTTNDLSGVTAFRLELLTDVNLPYGGPGRSHKGINALSEFIAEAIDPQNQTNKMKVKFIRATADYNQPERPLDTMHYDKTTNNRVTGPISFAIDGNANTAWGIDAGPGQRNQERKAVFVAERPAGFPGGTLWRIGLQQNHGGWNSDDHMNNNLGRFRLSATTAPDPEADPLPKKVRDILSIPRAQRTPAQSAAVFSYWRTTVPEWKDANDKIASLWARWPEGATSLALLMREEPRDTRVLRRGDWLKPTKHVETGVPAFLHSLPKDADNSRLTFARWLADPRSPTTARVFVNRIWQAYFGMGIVGTPEDFGMQADAPSHPELLDWLACEFMDHGWSIKHMHRLIVNSATYRQSSKVSEELYARDPYNRLLARGPRFRVEGEIVRDIALSVSGLLNAKLGGRSVMPPAPAFLFQPPASYAPFPWKDEQGAEKYRRALYTFRRRSTPHPALQTFDVPNADFSCVRRQRSNSPLQALVSLNEPIFVECARALAQRILQDGGKSDADRITYAFRRALSRPPNKAEKQELLALLEKQKQRIAEGALKPGEFIDSAADAAVNLPAGATPEQFAAYTIVARVLLNLDETITKE